MRKITLFTASGKEEREVYLSEERAIRLWLNDTLVKELESSPTRLKELAIGYLVSEGLLTPSAAKEARVEFDEAEVRVKAEEEAWGGLPAPPEKFRREAIFKASETFDELCEEWRLTGGTHCAASFDPRGEAIAAFEDVNRLSALEKLIGHVVLEDIREGFFLLTGRLSGKIVRKAARLGVPLIASRSAALRGGVEEAEKAGVTLLGFLRGRSFVAYCNDWRII